MGTQYLFKCPSCDYSVVVSGGDDIGMACRTTRIVCETCEELSDVVVSDKPLGAAARTRGRHPVCCGPNGGRKRPSHKVRRWTVPGSCPKCGATIVNGEECVRWD